MLSTFRAVNKGWRSGLPLATLTLSVSRVTKVNFLHTKSIHNQGKMWWELIKQSPDVKSFDQQTKSLNQFFKEMYGDQSGEFVFGYWA